MGQLMVTDVCYFSICISKDLRSLLAILFLILFIIMVYYVLHKIGFLEKSI